MAAERIMEWAAKGTHLGGIPRKMTFMAVGTFAKAVANLFNTTTVRNADTLLRLVRSRPPGVPLLTVSNHMSTLGNCIPITRGGGIYQEHMNEALERLRDGAWLHTFPEGKVCQEATPIRRLKWGTASLIVRSPITPIVLPIVHLGFDKVMPEKYMFDRKPPVPLWGKKIDIIIGEPIEFDLPKLKQTALSESRNWSHSVTGWPTLRPSGLDEAAQRYIYTTISEQIRTVMEKLQNLGKTQVDQVTGS